MQAAKSALARALRAADYYGIAGPDTARFSARLPGRTDVLLLSPSQGWGAASTEHIVAVYADEHVHERAGDVDSAVINAHLGMHAAVGRDWVLHLYSHHIIESAVDLDGSFARLLMKLSRCSGERIVTRYCYGEPAVRREVPKPQILPDPSVDILQLAHSGIGVCGDTLEHAFDDLYHIERASLGNYILRSSSLEPAVVSGLLSGLLCSQYEALKASFLLASS